MNRRNFLKVLSAGALSAALPIRTNTNAERSPNVLLVAIDDLNDWTGFLGGHPDVRTPNLDRLAQRGMAFTQAYSPAPLCNPSRTSVLTGFQPATTGIYENRFDLAALRHFSALGNIVTLPQHFMQNSYHVMGGGKVFHYADPASWQESFLEYPEGYTPGIDLELENGQPRDGMSEFPLIFDWGPLDVPDEASADWKLVNWASEKLRQKYDQPFFLGVGLFRPHLPWYVPRRYFDMYPADTVTLPEVLDNDLDDVPPIALDTSFNTNRAEWHDIILRHGKWREAVSAYLASISFLDARIGELLAALDQSGYAENTVIVLWSDHGWLLGEKTYWSKDVLWEEALHIPLIFVAPGIISPGGRCSHPVSSLSVYQTLSTLCGLPEREGLEGPSLMPLLENPNAGWSEPVVSTRGFQNHSIRLDKWRYTRYVDGSEELYDHENDPLEWHNLAPDSLYRAVKEELAQYLPGNNVIPPEKPK
jgi:choline-sulfatase